LKNAALFLLMILGLIAIVVGCDALGTPITAGYG
jgi:hypothetical protein